MPSEWCAADEGSGAALEAGLALSAADAPRPLPRSRSRTSSKTSHALCNYERLSRQLLDEAPLLPLLHHEVERIREGEEH